MPWEGLNRRKFPRVQFPCMMKIFLKDGYFETILAHTENISTGGVCLIVKKSLEQFSQVDLEIDLMDDGLHIFTEGKVVWSIRRKATDPVKGSFYDTGIEYINMKCDEAARIVALIGHFSKKEQK